MKNIIYFLSLLMFSQGCTVNYSLSGASISPDVKTITIEYFENKATLAPPSISQLFTENLKSTFLTQTNLAMVNKQGDLQFSGYISSYVSGPSAIQDNNNAALNKLTIAVKVTFVNTKDPKQNFEKVYSNSQTYSTASNLTAIEETLITQISELIAQSIFSESVGNW